jgi:hypothetical protein
LQNIHVQSPLCEKPRWYQLGSIHVSRRVKKDNPIDRIAPLAHDLSMQTKIDKNHVLNLEVVLDLFAVIWKMSCGNAAIPSHQW